MNKGIWEAEGRGDYRRDFSLGDVKTQIGIGSDVKSRAFQQPL